MPTELQKLTFNIRNKKIKEGKPLIMKEVMLEAGYGIGAATHPTKTLIKTPGWQELLNMYDEKPVMDVIYEDALSEKDKRNATENRKLFLKVKGRLNDQIRIGKLDDELGSIFDD